MSGAMDVVLDADMLLDAAVEYVLARTKTAHYRSKLTISVEWTGDDDAPSITVHCTEEPEEPKP